MKDTGPQTWHTFHSFLVLTEENTESTFNLIGHVNVGVITNRGGGRKSVKIASFAEDGTSFLSLLAFLC